MSMWHFPAVKLLLKTTCGCPGCGPFTCTVLNVALECLSSCFCLLYLLKTASYYTECPHLCFLWLGRMQAGQSLTIDWWVSSFIWSCLTVPECLKGNTEIMLNILQMEIKNTSSHITCIVIINITNIIISAMYGKNNYIQTYIIFEMLSLYCIFYGCWLTFMDIYAVIHMLDSQMDPSKGKGRI